MLDREAIHSQINKLMAEINCCLSYLYNAPCLYKFCIHTMLLNQLRDKISTLHFLINLLTVEVKIPGPPAVPSVPGQPPAPPLIPGTPPPQLQQPFFTLSELSAFTGRNGKPAYVAVNGIVYDVTNNAAWAAGTHFGLTAGRDLTAEFANCHQAQQILNKLPVVGRLL